MITVNGNVLEGGGQILRMSIVLSCILKKPIKIINIRAGREKPGLASQHMNGIQLAQNISGASVSGLYIGSTELEFHPSRLTAGNYSADTKTAGSIALLIQIALPLVLFCESPSSLNLKGGTNAEHAPQIDFTTEIFRPNLEMFGASFDFTLFHRGYFPKGGGHCKIDVCPVKYLQPIQLTDFGDISQMFGWSYVAGKLPIHMADEMVNGAKDTLKHLPMNSSIGIEAYKESVNMATENASGIIIGCRTTTNCILGGSALGSRKEQPYETGKKAANDLFDSLSKKSCVDIYIQDQLIIFMVLAKGKSRIKCNSPLTLHTQTAIYIAELFTDVKFIVSEQGEHSIIECSGMGYENESI